MIELAVADGIGRLELARPAARNAIPLAGWDRIAGAVRDAEQAGARLLLVTGTGGHFCAGADLTEFDGFRGDPAACAEFRSAMRRGIDALAESPLPCLALLEGGCYGAGVALALACDLRLAAPGARFAITPARFGISYPQRDVHRLVGLVGRGQASRLLLGGSTIAAEEAVRIGLADFLCETGVEAAAEAIGAEILACDPLSLATLKRGIRLAADGVTGESGQDRRFDELLASETPVLRLAERRLRR